MGFLDASDYCDTCLLDKEVKLKKIVRYSKRNDFNILTDMNDTSNVDVLIITDMIEIADDLRKFEIQIKKYGLTNYVIAPAISCRTQNYALPSPTGYAFNYCNKLDISKYNPKVVMTTGRAIYKFTEESVFISWWDFSEINFDETWFLPKFDSKLKVRVYPISHISEAMKLDSFEHYHFMEQIKKINLYLEKYEPVIIPLPYKIIVEDFNSFCRDNKNKKHVAIDTETNSLNCYIDNFEVGCVTMSFDGVTGYYIPIKIIDKELFTSFLKDKFCIWANGKFDIKALESVGFKDIRVDEDVTILFHVLNTERKSNSLKVLSWLVGYGGYENKLNQYIKKYKIDNYLNIPEETLSEYAVMDAIVTFRVWQHAKKYLIPKQPDTYSLYRDVLIPVIPVLKDMEKEGMLVDADYVTAYHKELQDKCKIIEKEIHRIAGKEFNISSNKDLAIVLKELGLPNYGLTKTGEYRTGKEILQQWKNDGYEIIDKLMEYRVLTKLDNTFVGKGTTEEEENLDFLSFSEEEVDDAGEGIAQHIMTDGRVHCTILPAIARTLRCSCADPNLQQQPRQGEQGKAFRKVFIAPKDYILCEADYAGFQLRIAALYSNDPVMKNIFCNLSGDMHSITAINVFHRDMSIEEFLKVKNKEPYKTSRQKSKNIGFGFLFGRVAASFKKDIENSWSEKDITEYIKKNKLKIHKDRDGKPDKILTVAEDIRNKFFETYPNLIPWMEECQAVAKRQGYIDSKIFKGGRRHLPALLQIGSHLSKEDQKKYSNLYNISINTSVQLFEAIVIYKALVKIHTAIKKNNLKSKLIITVHDSIVMYIHKDEIEQMYYIIKEGMEVFDYDIPITCEISLGDIWGFSSEIKESNIKEFVERYK